MRRNRGTSYEEGPPSRMRLSNVVDGTGRKVVGVVGSLAADGRFLVLLPCGVPIAVGEWVEQEVGRSPSSSMRLIIVVGGVGIKELASVVRGVTGILKPNRQIVVIEALANELGISTWDMSTLKKVLGSVNLDTHHTERQYP